MLDTKTVLMIGIVALISYLLGSLNFALILSRFVVKDDIRRHGSGNAGMTNILRTYGKSMAILTAAGDFLKAVIAITLSRWLFYRFGIGLLDPGYLSGLFVLLGHLYPLYFHFKGGKGVVTSLAVIFATNPLVFAIILVVFLPVVVISKIVSLGSVLGAITYPILTGVTNYMRGMPVLSDTVFALIIGAIVLVKHRENIKRLMAGTENKFGSKK